ncbi:MAG: DUF424 family protein [archaeon]
MIGKIHNLANKIIFAACDKELLNKTIKLNSEVEITINSSFYGTDLISKQTLIDNIAISESCNLIGEKVISILIKNKIINKSDIIYLDKIPHIQIYKM